MRYYMENRKLIIAIIIVMIAAIGIFSYMQIQSSDSTFQVGKSTFKLPEGYKEAEYDQPNSVKISNGENEVFISAKDDTDNLDDKVHSFAKSFDKDGRPTIITNFTVDNVFVYKLNLENDTHDCYYWFKNNGEVYDIYMWDGNDKIETIVFDLIRSME